MVDIKTNGYFTMSCQNKPVSINMDGTRLFFHPPVVLFNVLNQLRLDVWLSWNSDGLLHEWLIEVNFIYLQFQLLGDLEKDTFKQPVNVDLKLKSTNKNNYNQLLKKTKKNNLGVKSGKELDKWMELLSSIIVFNEVWEECNQKEHSINSSF